MRHFGIGPYSETVQPLRIGIVGFDQVDALDLVGPAEAFASAQVDDARGNPGPAYEVVILGLTSARFVAESGIVFQPRTTLRAAPRLDTIIIPGGAGLRRADTTRAVVRWIQERAGKTRRVVSICTGIYALAASGLLDGRRVTTHWRFAADVARRFPNLRVQPNSLFTRDGNFCTSAGVTAGIDLTLALIEEDLGRQAALRVARDLVVYMKRPGGQDQYSEPLRFQTMATDRLAELASWIATNPQRDLSIPVLAGRACLSPRHFVRRFKTAFGQSPGAFVQDRRLDEARRRLTAENISIDAIAASVGFQSTDAFRRAFRHRFRITPTRYRRNFGLDDNPGEQ
ncbi:MAG: helix-turn-helix domain-containing protein [Spartobacteria bacterium]